MKRVFRLIAQGMALVLPLLVTASIVIWLGSMAEGLLGGLLKSLLGTSLDAEKPEVGWLELESVHYVWGMGIAAGLILALAVGIVTRWWLIRKTVELAERWVQKIPLVKTLYGGIKDMLGLVGGKKASFSRVVLIRLPGSELDTIGLVTRDDLSGLGFQDNGRGLLAIYVPMSYMIGGLTFIVPADQVSPIDMGVEEAMRFAMTAGVSAGKESGNEAPATQTPDGPAD